MEKKDATSMEGIDLISGIFSVQSVRKVGTGTTTRKTIQKQFFSCKEMPDGQIEAQLLNSNYIPSGPTKRITKDQFLEQYSPEPEFYVTKVYPKIRELNKTVALADRHRDKGEYYSAEMEYNSALNLDIENVKANFGLGITYLNRGEKDKAENIFQRLVKLDAAFEAEHKHLFNEFGISLRKNQMFGQAIDYYGRAIELSSEDENLHCNIARAYLENNDYEKAMEHLLKATSLIPDHDVSIKFIHWMVKKNLVPPAQKGAANTAISNALELKPSILNE